MSALDYNTAIRGIRVANSDFLQLLYQLRDVLTSSKELTFTLGDEDIVIEGLLALIDNYRNGKFQSVTIGTAPDCVKLSIDDGNLKVTDLGGNLVGVVCSGLSFSDIADTTIASATLRDCEVESVNGSVAVSGGNVSFDNIEVTKLTATSIVARNVNGYTASVESSYTSDLYIQGDRRMAFPDQRNVFYDDGVAVDGFASKILSGYSDGVWTWDSTTDAKPSMLGLTAMDRVGIPSLITICGNNNYNDFKDIIQRPYGLKNLVAWMSGVSGDENLVSMSSDNYVMASVFLWPYATYELYAPYQSDTKDIVVSEFREEDIGKEVYYRTSASSWTIYRTLKMNYNNLSPISAQFGSPYEIPPYSCVKFIVSRTGSAQEGSTVSILEIA
jgi:hypothetical protein